MSAAVAVARWPSLPFRWLIVLKWLKHQVWTNAEHGNGEPRSGHVYVRLGPVAPIVHARHFRCVERSDPIKLIAADYVAIEPHGRFKIWHR